MPTSRKRHTITETDAVAAVLDRVRLATGGEVNLPELVRLGGEAKLRRLEQERIDDERRRALRRRFADRTLTGEGIDEEALAEVRQRGWARG